MTNGENSFKRYLAGDDSAFTDLVGLYFDKLTYFVNGYVNDVAAAEDIAQDTLTELAIHPERFRADSSLKTFLFSIGRHKALNYVKRRKRIAFVPLDGVDAEDGRTLENEVLDDIRKRTVADALGKLPEAMRQAVTLVYIEGMSYAEAARVLGKSGKQIDNLLTRAKKELRTIIGKEGGELL